jgi:hypothetical protein
MSIPRASWLNPLVTALGAALLVTACSSGPALTPDVTPGPPSTLTPLIGAALTEPVPVPSTDGRTHLAYELQLTNTLSGAVTLQSLTVASGDRRLLTLAGDNLKYWTRALGNTAVATNVLGPGQSALVWLDVALDSGAEVPTDLTHSVHLSVAKPRPGLIANDVTQNVAPVQVSTRTPVSISPPLDGPNWLDGDSCCAMTAHRMAVNPINGTLIASERFAVDYVQLTNDFRLFTGNPTRLESYPYYNATIHAVGDGKVVSVRDDLPDQVPGKSPTGLPLDQYAGNHIVQDLGHGNFALYAHLKPGSITVKPGDKLTAKQTIATLGNSGNSDAPHLHFHVIDGPDPLAANGLPFVIDSFRLVQRIASMTALEKLFTGQPAPLQPSFASRDAKGVGPLVLDVMDYSVGQ